MANGTLATDIKTFACKHTGVSVNYKKVTTWYDGTTMSDAKCDGTIYRKLVTGGITGYYVDTDFLDGKPLNPLRFGMKGDGVFDNSNIMDYILALPIMPKIVLHFPIKGNFYFSRAINLKREVIFKGFSEGLMNNSDGHTRFTFADGVDGIIVNRYNSNGKHKIDTTNGTGRADGSQIENIALKQLGTNVTYTYYDINTDINRCIGLAQITEAANGTEMKCVDAWNVNVLGEPAAIGNLTFTNLFNNVKIVVVNELSSVFTLGQTVTWAGGTATGTIEYLLKDQSVIGIKTSFNLNSNTVITVGGVDYFVNTSIYGWYSVREFNAVSGTFPKVGVLVKNTAYGTGIKLLARATVRNCNVINFKYFGISGLSNFGNNLNCSRIDNITIQTTGIHGFYMKGADSNACDIRALNVNQSSGINIYDDSFLGNYYFGCHTSVHGLNAYKSDGLNNFSVFIGCYSEGWGDSSPLYNRGSIFSPKTRVVGGDHGSAIYPDESFGHIDEGLNWRKGTVIELETDNASSQRQEHGLSLTGKGTDSWVNMTLSKNGFGDYLPAIGFSKLSPFGAKKVKTTAAILRGGASFNGIGTFIMSLSDGYSGGVISTSVTALNTSHTAYNAILHPVIEGGNLVSLEIGYAGANQKSITINGNGFFDGLVAEGELVNGVLKSVRIITPPTAQGSLPNTNPKNVYHFEPTQIYPTTTNYVSLGKSTNRWKETHTEKIFLNGTELKQSEAPSNTANAIGATYSQSEVQAILNELRDLKNKLKAAGITA